MATADKPIVAIAQRRKQHHRAVVERRLCRHFAPPVFGDRDLVVALKRMRIWIEPYVDLADRQDDVARQVETHGLMSRLTTTGQWSEAFGLSQPARGRRSTSWPDGKMVRQGWPLRMISGTAVAFFAASAFDTRI